MNIREKNLLNNMNFPGINRYMMPEIPEKSENLRKAEKSQYYPFISSDVNEVQTEIFLI